MIWSADTQIAYQIQLQNNFLYMWRHRWAKILAYYIYPSKKPSIGKQFFSPWNKKTLFTSQWGLDKSRRAWVVGCHFQSADGSWLLAIKHINESIIQLFLKSPLSKLPLQMITLQILECFWSSHLKLLRSLGIEMLNKANITNLLYAAT